ncbi:hypothetical protein M493_09875 [Geobacillus genomosp. 3]|uniref:Uncharacterized protein n=1 Tax=Geobacillus genomosp. 3 TaxID=1921421 RepID=S6A2E7_GEOG3|nr:hypothetical protein M493_09875 [Geobacillus genomosp. 3]
MLHNVETIKRRALFITSACFFMQKKGISLLRREMNT